MSETGATDAQIEAAIRRYMEQSELPECYIESALQERPSGTVMTVDAWAKYLVPPGYQIVPAGAVVLSAEEAEDVRDALSYATSYQEPPLTERQEKRVKRYRALAAKLSGGAS